MTKSNFPPLFTPMLATPAPAPFDSAAHWFELKWDGVRLLAYIEEGRTRLYSRRQREVTAQYPEFADLHSRMKLTNAVIDGEIFVADEKGRPSFELVQQRINQSRPADVRRTAAEYPAQLVCFDLVFADGEWIGDEPLSERRELLSSTLAFDDRVVCPDPIPEKGVAFFEAAKARGLEGIVAKQISSRYVPGRRTRNWLKIKVVNTVEVVIGGWSPGRGGRSSSFGSLLMGLYDDEGLRYIGSVGTGFTDRTLKELQAKLNQLEIARSPFAERIPFPGLHWVKPELVGEVEYREMTSQLILRAASFKALRPDLSPEECRLEKDEVHKKRRFPAPHRW